MGRSHIELKLIMLPKGGRGGGASGKVGGA